MKNAVLSVIAVCGLAAVASAQSVSYDDTTLGGPTWNRPVADNITGLPAGLSGVGSNTPMHVQAFYVGTSGGYGFSSVSAPGTEPWDNYLWLYGPTFNPATPLVDAIKGNDDNPGVGQSGFTMSLIAGQQYYLVTTGFGNADAGAFHNTISWREDFGVGQITLGTIPTPGAAALASLGTLLAARRRRK